MASIKVGETIPEGTFKYIPWSEALESQLACGTPVTFTTNDWKGKKVVVISVPGAFTPTCHANHLPPFAEKYDELKKKGVDVIAVLAANDPFVMSGWARFLGLKDKIIAISDVDAAWSKKLGLEKDLTANGMGVRTARYALVLENNVVKYLGVETEPGVAVSGVDAVLAHL
ncbi:thioredoxin-dependent peroxidase [Coprinopsis marcescibilis]|uniref:Putative peroxiredoxin n=1 Tax=Coprinopsis marcescibilis TaxID=230819 RepID=A0A5C3KSV3_COPMA|nr:thioredoxin-dependent peroxidase [Coprinopsis marcescibilis]